MVNLPSETRELEDDFSCHPFTTIPPPEPKNLQELESIATKTASLMNPFSAHPNCYQIVMNRVREFYNLEFRMFCQMTDTTHRQDEVTAPER